MQSTNTLDPKEEGAAYATPSEERWRGELASPKEPQQAAFSG
jgi:hypothetical protein